VKFSIKPLSEEKKKIEKSNMLSQVAVEALYSAAYVENYLDSVENLPDDIQKYMTKLREIDSKSDGNSTF
jgi:hypothetical protein